MRPDRCKLGHNLVKMKKTPFMVEDPDEKGAFRPVNEAICKYKYCLRNDNRENGPNPKIDFLNESFWGWCYCEEVFAVHMECFGGVDRS